MDRVLGNLLGNVTRREKLENLVTYRMVDWYHSRMTEKERERQ